MRGAGLLMGNVCALQEQTRLCWAGHAALAPPPSLAPSKFLLLELSMLFFFFPPFGAKCCPEGTHLHGDKGSSKQQSLPVWAKAVSICWCLLVSALLPHWGPEPRHGFCALLNFTCSPSCLGLTLQPRLCTPAVHGASY